MRKDWSHFELFRKRDHSLWSSEPGDTFGTFVIPTPEGLMVCIASDGDEEIPWEHVSLRMDTRRGQRCPSWSEMCHAKDLFWPEDEAVVQFHPAKKDYVNQHEFVLHLWRPRDGKFPTPPTIAVGIK